MFSAMWVEPHRAIPTRAERTGHQPQREQSARANAARINSALEISLHTSDTSRETFTSSHLAVYPARSGVVRNDNWLQSGESERMGTASLSLLQWKRPAFTGSRCGMRGSQDVGISASDAPGDLLENLCLSCWAPGSRTMRGYYKSILIAAFLWDCAERRIGSPHPPDSHLILASLS